MTPADVLRRAADYIAEHGWKRGDMGDHGGPRCAVGALHSAVGAQDYSHLGDDSERLVEAAWTLAEVRIPCQSLSRWNDQPHRTAEEVISTLRTVASRLDAHPGRDRGEGEA